MAHLSDDRRPAERVRRRPRRAPGHRGGDLRRAARGGDAPISAGWPRPSTSGSSTACPPSGSRASSASSAARPQKYVERYFARYPGREALHGRRRARRRARPGYVETVFGRRLYLPDIRSGNKQLRQYAERSAINAPMQGTAADIIKRAMIAVDGWCQREDVPARAHHAGARRAGARSAARTRSTRSPQRVHERMAGAAELKVPLKSKSAPARTGTKRTSDRSACGASPR